MAGNASRVFRVLIDADASGAVRELNKFEKESKTASGSASREANRMSATFGKVKVAAAAVGVTAAISIGKQAVDAASDLNESINAVQVSYGSASDAVLRLGEQAAHGAGLSERAFNEAAVAVQAFVSDVADGSGRGTAEVLDELITRAADFGSVFNIDVDEALQRFRSGLAGETEPLRKFGINLLQSEVNAYAFANGIAEVGDELTESQKVTARYGLLMEKTSKFQGDFANTSGDLANQQRIMRARLENLTAQLGESLVPAALAATEAMIGIIGILEQFKVPEALKGIADLFAGLGPDLGLVNESVGNVVDSLDGSAGSRLRAFGDLASDVGEAQGAFAKGADALRVLNRFGDQSMINAENFREAFTELNASSRKAAIELTNDLDDILAAAGRGEEAAQKYVDTWGITPKVIEQFKREIGATDVTMLEFVDTTENLTEQHASLSDVFVDAAQNLMFLEHETKGKANADKFAAAEAAAHEAAVEALKESIDDVMASMFDYEDATLSLENSVDQFRMREEELAETLADSEVSAREKQIATNDLRLAEIALADRALATARTYAEQQGAAEGSTASYALQKEELLRLAEQFPRLRDEIQLYIEQLNRIPDVIGTQITLGYSGGRALRTTGNGLNFGNTGTTGVRAMADGGIVRRPTLALIGEAGPEAVVPLTTGGTPLPGNGMGDVSISIGQVVTQAQHGQQLLDELTSAIRRQGPSGIRRAIGVS